MTDRPPARHEAEAPRDSDAARSGVVSAARSYAQLEAENARLSARVAELEASARGRPAGDEGGTGTVTYQKLLTLLDNAPNRIFLKDLEHRIIFVNQRFADHRKGKPEDFLGLT